MNEHILNLFCSYLGITTERYRQLMNRAVAERAEGFGIPVTEEAFPTVESLAERHDDLKSFLVTLETEQAARLFDDVDALQTEVFELRQQLKQAREAITLIEGEHAAALRLEYERGAETLYRGLSTLVRAMYPNTAALLDEMASELLPPVPGGGR